MKRKKLGYVFLNLVDKTILQINLEKVEWLKW
jgi:hypothetical protein